MKTLHLTLKKKWFDMIASGEKTEEYREIKDYWAIRFGYSTFKWNGDTVHLFDEHFEEVYARNGYSKTSPSIRWKNKWITVGEGKPEWGAEKGKKYFILEIGEIIKNETDLQQVQTT